MNDDNACSNPYHVEPQLPESLQAHQIRECVDRAFERAVDTNGKLSRHTLTKELLKQAQAAPLGGESNDSPRSLTLATARIIDAVTDLQRDLKDMRIAHLAAESTIAAVVETVGGTVEGQPTSRVNVLQRLRELVVIEADYISGEEGEDAPRSPRTPGCSNPRTDG